MLSPSDPPFSAGFEDVISHQVQLLANWDLR